MDTKLKNFSRSTLTKLAVFVLSVFMLYCMVQNTADFIYYNRSEDLGLMAESVFCDSFFETDYLESAVRDSLHYVFFDEDDSSYDMSLLEYAISPGDGTLIYSGQGDIKSLNDLKNGDYIVMKGGYLSEAHGQLPQSLVSSINYGLEFEEAVIKYPPAFFKAQSQRFDQYHEIAGEFVQSLMWYTVIFILCFVFLCAKAGRRPNEEEVVTVFPDNIWTETHLISLFMLFICVLFILDDYMFSLSYAFHLAVSSFNFFKLFLSVSICAGYGIFAWIVFSLIRKIKAKTFFKSSFIYWFILQLRRILTKLKAYIVRLKSRFSDIINNFTSKDFKDIHFAITFHKAQKRYIIFSVLCLFFTMIFLLFGFAVESVFIIFFIFCLSVIIWLYVSYLHVKKSHKLAQSMTRLLIQIDKVSSGELEYDAGIEEGDFLSESSHKLANIGEGLNKALSEQLKSERMKIELITNVSHDLKTPLTSIISYIDLLKKEELSDVAGDYVNILAQKADRLKGIVSDLFDLAKTNSGNIELHLEPLDLAKLTRQLLADMDDKISASHFTVKTNLPLSPAVIKADGKKLSRALQNVLDNALKYSLDGSRIYVDLITDDDCARLTVKNTASYEMNFTAEEISQRFVRGDKTRSTDGSGLGLSIAQSFTEVLGGEFKVLIDGDQFKTVFSFPLCDEDISVQTADII